MAARHQLAGQDQPAARPGPDEATRTAGSRGRRVRRQGTGEPGALHLGRGAEAAQAWQEQG